MAHGDAEIVVPVGAVKAIALIEIHDIGHIGQVVIGTGAFDAPFHFGVLDFVPDAILACGGGGKFA